MSTSVTLRYIATEAEAIAITLPPGDELRVACRNITAAIDEGREPTLREWCTLLRRIREWKEEHP